MNRQAIKILMNVLITLSSQIEELTYKSVDDDLANATYHLKNTTKYLREYLIKSE